MNKKSLIEHRKDSFSRNDPPLPFHQRAYRAGWTSAATLESGNKRERAIRNKNMMGYEPGEIEAIADRMSGFAEYHDGDWHQR